MAFFSRPRRLYVRAPTQPNTTHTQHNTPIAHQQPRDEPQPLSLPTNQEEVVKHLSPPPLPFPPFVRSTFRHHVWQGSQGPLRQGCQGHDEVAGRRQEEGASEVACVRAQERERGPACGREERDRDEDEPCFFFAQQCPLPPSPPSNTNAPPNLNPTADEPLAARRPAVSRRARAPPAQGERVCVCVSEIGRGGNRRALSRC